MSDFHFIYPGWLMLLPLLAGLLYWLRRFRGSNEVWDSFVDKSLQPFVISGKTGNRRGWLFWLLASGLILGVIALSGPSFIKRQVPAWQINQGLVVVLDLSSSMLARDVAPDRLSRARFELNDLMQMRKEGQTGLVVFAGDAFPVAPMTDDNDTITAQVEHLDPYTMPSQGSRADRAIKAAKEMLTRAGYAKGHILMIMDGAAELDAAAKEATAAAQAGFQVSVLQIGTAEGEQIPLRGGGFLVNRQGERIRAIVDEKALQDIAAAGQGFYVVSTVNDRDLVSLLDFMQISANASIEKDESSVLEYSENAGIWLLFPLLLVVALMFRKGYLFVVVLIVLPQPQPLYALDWQSLWKNPQQRGEQALREGDYEKAKELLGDQQWQGANAYRSGDYTGATKLFGKGESPQARYNEGNALMHQQRYQEAAKAYQEALEVEPDFEDAQHNLGIARKLAEQQKQQQQQQGGQQQQQPAPDEQQQNQQPGEGEQQQADDGQQQEKQNSGEEQDKEGEEGQQQQAEQEQGEQRKHGDEARDISEADEQNEKEELEKAAFRKQFLRKVPDDPSGLWRRKFEHQYRQRGQRMEEQQW